VHVQRGADDQGVYLVGQCVRSRRGGRSSRFGDHAIALLSCIFTLVLSLLLTGAIKEESPLGQNK
jgi:hypothetical protein